MLYFQALTEGLNDLPEADHAVRLVIDTMAEEEGWPAVHEKLARVDPETAARLAPNDAQRDPARHGDLHAHRQADGGAAEEAEVRLFPVHADQGGADSERPRGAAPPHRDAVRRDAPLGLPEELRKLREEYGLEPGMPSMRCVGYRQAWDYLDGRIGAAALREQGIAATRQLAKRQLTWLRSMDDVTEFDCLASDLPDMVLEYIRRELEALIAAE